MESMILNVEYQFYENDLCNDFLAVEVICIKTLISYHSLIKLMNVHKRLYIQLTTIARDAFNSNRTMDGL